MAYRLTELQDQQATLASEQAEKKLGAGMNHRGNLAEWLRQCRGRRKLKMAVQQGRSE